VSDPSQALNQELIRRLIEQAHQEWMAALDVVKDPIFLHDKEFRIVRCNKAYQQCAGLPFKQIIGQPYYEVFPKTHAPLRHCRLAMESAEAHSEEELTVDGKVFRSRSYPIQDEAGDYLYSIHTLEDITGRKQDESRLRESEAFIKAVLDNLPVGIAVNTAVPPVVFNYMNDNFPAIYRTTRDKLADPDAFWDAVYEDPELRRQIRQRVLEDCASGDAGRMHWDDIPLTRNGEETAYISARDIPLSDKQLVISMVWDVTGRKRAEQVLQDEKKFSDALVQKLPDIFYLLDAHGKLLKWNANLQELSGLSDAEMSAASALDFIHEEDRPLIAGKIRQALETGSATADARLVLKNGIRDYALTGTRIETLQGLNIIGLGVDITARKQAELKLRESEERYRTLFETMLNGFAYCRMLFEDGRPSDFIYLDVNAAFEKQTGLKDVVGKRVSEVIPGIRESDPELFERYGRVAQGGKPEQFETYVESLKMWFFISVYSPKAQHFVAVFDVITARKQTEDALKNEALRRRMLMQSSQDGIAIVNQRHQVVEANARFAEMLGYTPEEVLTLHTWDFEANMTEAEIRANFANLLDTSMTIETRHRRKDGTVYEVEVSLGGTMVGGEPVVFTISRDITERKQHEIAMKRANRALRTISAGNQALIHATEEEQLLHEMCEVAVQAGGYRMAWIGYARDDADRTIEQMAQAGFEESGPDLSLLKCNVDMSDSCPAGQTIISGETRVVQDVLNDPEGGAWREGARRYGYASCIALPLMDGEHAFGSLVLFDDKVNTFDADEIELLQEMSGDLAFGILTLRVKAAHREHEQRLQKNMLQTVEAIASIVEMRDPYTSGHQARVAVLAQEIARQMGLPEEQMRAIHLAGLVHDLGKIQVPAEILSKPGRLTELEYSMIKMHPRAGYDILKGVDFSWPIAEMVWQHHERMDGSGYPRGLKGEEILPAARILSVADLVEAMSSHRPYRAGLGIDAALDEIIRGRGTLFDAQVVDACVALFREQNYVLPN
jgi:PAS domain S-box-containing protein